MRTAKICVVGDFAVGKTSTVARVVHNEFSEKYLTTVGVKIDIKNSVLPDGEPIKLVFWDIAGTDVFSEIEFAYLRGASAYLLIADGSRANTVATAHALRAELEDRYGDIPFVALLNKSDLESEWEVGEDEITHSEQAGIQWKHCSARTGESLEAAIQELIARI